jgi:hypothetical protein
MINVLVKDLRTEEIIDSVPFSTVETAEIWMDAQMLIWEEDRAYKIVEDAQ